MIAARRDRDRAFVHLALLLALLGALFAAKDLLLRPPAVRPPAAGAFDAARAAGRLQRILGDERPHPVDSAAGDAVRTRIVAELRALGLAPRITDDFACNGSSRSRTIGCARVRNVIATVGSSAGRHLLLVSHYDSTPVGPGAADDGIGVATMLEVAALLRGRRLEGPVTFLFNEGEEAGLIGARAFLARDPIAARVAALLNFEARGVSGPAIMFETSVPNAAAVAHYTEVARPVANSLSTAFYRLIPNSTDVAVFAERPGWTILNFAVIGNETRYHSPGDTLAGLDRRSLQHMGDQALALTLRMAGRADPAPAGDSAFADLAGRTLIVMPGIVALAGLAVALLAIAVIAWRRRRGLGRAALATAGALPGAAALVWLGQRIVGWAAPGEFWRGTPAALELAAYLTAALAAATAIAFARRPTRQLRAAFWLIFLLLGAGLSAALPGAAIFFLLPPLPAIAGMALAGRAPAAERIGSGGAAAALLLFWAPLLGLLETTLDHDAMWLFAPLAGIIMLPALIEISAISGALSRPARAGLAALAVAAWVGTMLAPRYTADRKQQFGIEYAAEPGAARWLVANDGAPLPSAFPAAARFSRVARLPWSTRPRWAAPAPPGLAAAPSARVVRTTRTPAGRIVSLRIAAAGAETVILRGPPRARVLAVRANDWVRRMGAAATGDYTIRCQGRSCDGLQLDLLLGGEPSRWSVIGITPGLPAAAQSLVAARPALAAPQYTPDATIGVARIVL